MRDELIVSAILVVVLSTPFIPYDTVLRYVASVIAVLLLFAIISLKPRKSMPETWEGPAKSSSDIQGNFSGSNGFFHKARNFVMNNPIMIYIQGEDKTSRIMESLLNHIIPGSAYDDSARTYPPRCHPGTRVRILERFTTWFYNNTRLKPLLWLCGPAGVGKSAILQTFAESVKRPQAVASVFISRPNKRNDPNRIFTTIAYQLAVHVKAYRNYIVDRLSANPYLLNKSIEVQFQVFINEPFIERKIGTGGPPLAILLDGLDEIEGAKAQRDIIRLISTFTQEHPNVPLVWVISSRPEPHITNTFNEVSVQDSYMSEFLPIDSTDACEDVERFLRDSFDNIRREFSNLPLKKWPKETALAKLAVASCGLFIFAETAVRFIRDPDHANPIPRLQLVLSAIDRSRGAIEERPFALLDNLYSTILSDIPSGLLSAAKLLLKLALFFRSTDYPYGVSALQNSQTLRGMIMILQLDHHTAYAALNKCFSTLRIPTWERAHMETLTFLHASFADYLMDFRRSGEFYIAVDDAEDHILLSYLNLWHKHFGENSHTPINFVDEYNETQDVSSEEIDKFDASILEDMARTLLSQMIEKHKSWPAASPVLQEKRLECLNSFQKVNMITLCNCKYLDNQESTFLRRTLFRFARKTFCDWEENTHELRASGFLRQISFKDISFDPRDFEADQGATSKQLQNSFAWSREGSTGTFSSQSPEVLICGMVPRGQVALIKVKDKGTKYYIVPYHEFSAQDEN